MKASLLRKPQLKPKTNVNELEKVADPLTRLTPLATLSPKGRGQEFKLTLPSPPRGRKRHSTLKGPNGLTQPLTGLCSFIDPCISNVLSEAQKKRAVFEEGAKQGRLALQGASMAAGGEAKG